ncbi:flagellar export chaperone FliS [Serpentinicella alkaliphila]|uniref:Flagellar secretion chaperone FliS n=2 Tax=Serpentinicella alkaliphila TaxID=1734049 RepID=A0A4V2T3K8_9FIRM|nr:flagellar export chaperone FliS [Serpentinicella alkaliphila]QUH24909.1 flagellar export chaperone FliS [Serpentinicella alkaliphila]TCQ01814.1 flagellar protein FliS [Serpentinicella alkaliphila]
MAMQNPYNNYKENSVKTASPEELTLMLYNGAIKFIGQSKIHIENKNIEKTNETIVRAQSIIQELNVTLNMDYEISKNLRMLYVFILDKLVDGNIKKEIAPLDEALEIVTSLRDTWKEAMKVSKLGNR